MVEGWWKEGILVEEVLFSMQEVFWNFFLVQYILGLKDVYNFGIWKMEWI